MTDPILIIGGGNMGGALAQAWLQAGIAPVYVVERDAARRDTLAAQGIIAHAAIAQAPQKIAALVLAVKPQQFPELAPEIKKFIGSATPLLISIMAGIPLASLYALSQQAVRVMPNLAALIGESMSTACGPKLDHAGRDFVTRLFEAAGSLAWLEDESALHAATAIAGSGPGYLFAFMEALERAAVAQGLDAALARRLVSKTFLGAATLADGATDSAAALRQQVSSPGGITLAALEIFGRGKLDTLVADAVAAAVARSKELAK